MWLEGGSRQGPPRLGSPSAGLCVFLRPQTLLFPCCLRDPTHLGRGCCCCSTLLLAGIPPGARLRPFTGSIPRDARHGGGLASRCAACRAAADVVAVCASSSRRRGAPAAAQGPCTWCTWCTCAAECSTHCRARDGAPPLLLCRLRNPLLPSCLREGAAAVAGARPLCVRGHPRGPRLLPSPRREAQRSAARFGRVWRWAAHIGMRRPSREKGVGG